MAGMIKDRSSQMGKSCRHWVPIRRYRDGENPCDIGHPIEKIVIARNGGVEDGIAYMFPCKPGPECLVNCPSYDPRTDDEIAERRARMDREIDKTLSALPKVMSMKRKMVANGISSAKSTCPWCGVKDALSVSCAIGYNNHIHCKCKSCAKGFME